MGRKCHRHPNNYDMADDNRSNHGVPLVATAKAGSTGVPGLSLEGAHFLLLVVIHAGVLSDGVGED